MYSTRTADDIRLAHETTVTLREEAAAPSWKGFFCDLAIVIAGAGLALGFGFGCATLLLMRLGG